MTSAIDPWPPSDATAAQPYDQRGCCWPWGTFGPYEKLQMRYLAIGVRNAGPIGAAWGRWKTGQVLQVWLPFSSLRVGYYYGGPSVPPAVRDALDIAHYMSTGEWFCNLTSVLDVFGNVALTASGIFNPSIPVASFDLLVTLATGAVDPPDIIRLTPVYWYQASPWPYYGP